MGADLKSKTLPLINTDDTDQSKIACPLESSGADSSAPHGSLTQDYAGDKGSDPRNSMSFVWLD